MSNYNFTVVYNYIGLYLKLMIEIKYLFLGNSLVKREVESSETEIYLSNADLQDLFFAGKFTHTIILKN